MNNNNQDDVDDMSSSSANQSNIPIGQKHISNLKLRGKFLLDQSTCEAVIKLNIRLNKINQALLLFINYRKNFQSRNSSHILLHFCSVTFSVFGTTLVVYTTRLLNLQRPFIVRQHFYKSSQTMFLKHLKYSYTVWHISYCVS